jgi:hypothetical protein
MKLPPVIATYLEQVASDELTTLADLSTALGAAQRAATMTGARLAMELAEIEEAHHEICARVIRTNAQHQSVRGETESEVAVSIRAQLNGDRCCESYIENAKQRTEYVRGKLQEFSTLITQLRRGIADLEHDQRVLATAFAEGGAAV